MVVSSISSVPPVPAKVTGPLNALPSAISSTPLPLIVVAIAVPPEATYSLPPLPMTELTPEPPEPTKRKPPLSTVVLLAMP